MNGGFLRDGINGEGGGGGDKTLRTPRFVETRGD